MRKWVSISSKQQHGQAGVVARTPSLFSCNPAWVGLLGGGGQQGEALWSSPGIRKKERRVCWGGSSASVFLSKGRVRLWVATAEMPGPLSRTGGESWAPGEPMRGQLAAFPSGPGQDGLLLVGAGTGSSGEGSPASRSSHTAREHGSRGAQGQHVHLPGQPGPGQGGAVLGKRNPRSQAHPCSNRRGHERPLEGWHSHSPCPPPSTLPAICPEGSSIPSLLSNWYNF